VWMRRCRVLFESAQRNAKPLSVIALCIENYADLKAQFGPDGSENAMGVLGRAIAATLAPSNAVSRLASTLFVIISPGADNKRGVLLAGRLERLISSASLTLGSRRLIAQVRSATSSLDTDRAESVEDLMKLAVHRALAGVRRTGGRNLAPGTTVSPPAADGLAPGERAVLRQVMRLAPGGPLKQYELNALSTGWPVLHRAAYMAAYNGLMKRGFIAASPEPQSFTLTSKGIEALKTL